MAQVAETVEALIEPAVTALGYELVGVEYIPQGRHSLLRIYIDTDNGITLGDCEKVSHQVSGILDVEEPVRGQYNLEVSSPGLERPLFKPAHYEKALGKQIQLKLHQAVEGRRKFSGLLNGCEDGKIVIQDESGETFTIAISDVDKANLIYEG